MILRLILSAGLAVTARVVWRLLRNDRGYTLDRATRRRLARNRKGLDVVLLSNLKR